MHDLLHRLPIHQHIEFKLCLIVFKCSHNLAPKYLSDYCQPVSSNPGRRNLRLAARGDLVVPPTRTALYSLPASLHDKQLSVTSFRRLLKTHLFRRAYVGTPWARSWLFPVRVGEHKLLDLAISMSLYDLNARTAVIMCYQTDQQNQSLPLSDKMSSISLPSTTASSLVTCRCLNPINYGSRFINETPPENCDLAAHNFLQFGPCWWSTQFLPYSAIFAPLLFNCPYSLHAHRILVVITPLRETGCGLMFVVGWLSQRWTVT